MCYIIQRLHLSISAFNMYIQINPRNCKDLTLRFPWLLYGTTLQLYKSHILSEHSRLLILQTNTDISEIFFQWFVLVWGWWNECWVVPMLPHQLKFFWWHCGSLFMPSSSSSLHLNRNHHHHSLFLSPQACNSNQKYQKIICIMHNKLHWQSLSEALCFNMAFNLVVC